MKILLVGVADRKHIKTLLGMIPKRVFALRYLDVLIDIVNHIAYIVIERR